MTDGLAPRPAASVILLRERAGTAELETFLLRRHRGAGFMAGAYVFPGGIAEEGDHGDLRVAAGRELFEEAGVFIGDADPALLPKWRKRLLEGQASFDDFVRETRATLSLDAFHYFAHWITPSIEKRRYSAQFYAALLPKNQTPSFDNRETVDEVWVTPSEGLERAKELKLPPPQVRTLWELAEAARRGWPALEELCATRARKKHPVLPRMMPAPDEKLGFALLLPWDRDYESKGTGEMRAIPAGHPLAVGPSRFVLRDGAWQQIASE